MRTICELRIFKIRNDIDTPVIDIPLRFLYQQQTLSCFSVSVAEKHKNTYCWYLHTYKESKVKVCITRPTQAKQCHLYINDTYT